jgi:hypothetical protein
MTETGPDSREMEASNQELLMLARELGFESTSELEALEREMQASVQDTERLRQLLGQWADMAERKHPGDSDAEVRSDIANMLVRAKIYRSLGMRAEAEENISDAADCAGQRGFEELENRINRLL